MADEFRLVTQKDGRVLPEDRAAANKFPVDGPDGDEDPGPVPPLDSPPRAEVEEAPVRRVGRPRREAARR